MDNQIQYVYFLRRLGVDAGRIIGGDLKEGFKEILNSPVFKNFVIMSM